MAPASKRTAILVVHGIGSQRAENTVRGVVDAVWFDEENPNGSGGAKKIWTHPERSGIDLDLAVMTTSAIPNNAGRHSADFHEFYWAHLMSETKAVAVLLWLYELGRRGPRFRPGMNALWWGAACFLCLMNLSIALLATQAVAKFVGLENNIEKLIITPYLMMFLAAVVGLCAVIRYRIASELPYAWLYLLVICVGPPLLFVIGAEVLTWMLGHSVKWLRVAAWTTNAFFPLVIALVATALLMGKCGLKAVARIYYLSLGFLAIYLVIAWEAGTSISLPPHYDFKLPWAINSQSSAVAAFVVIGAYLTANAAFLQPYLGDAARYFRNSPGNVAVRREIRKQAVDTLQQLHVSGSYDRIIVVAHSLGSVIAYDMLRAYYSQINQALPDPKSLGSDFEAVDQGMLPKAQARAKGREIIGHIAREAETAQQNIDAGKASVADKRPKSWLVTDFVTLGTPLTHAYYLMCTGSDGNELRSDFERRTREREFPTCPPRQLDEDRRLTFESPDDHMRRFHHGGMFALTRWTNLYFPLVKLFWGDAIGGPVAAIFGDPSKGRASCDPATLQNVADVAVYTNKNGRNDFFSHTRYWDTKTAEGYAAPHIVALKRAVDLEDCGTANAM